MKAEELTSSLKMVARQVGFDLAGACPAIEPTGFHQFLRWLEAGFHGEMTYLPNRRQAYRHPESVQPGTISLLLLGLNYQTSAPIPAGTGQGRVSRYAWSELDYHDLIRGKLKHLVAYCESLPQPVVARGIVDTAPLLEREFAQLAGLGWQAKNTMLINKRMGSWFFLAALLLDVPLQYDEPFFGSHCGTCTACLQACPTNAFVAPMVLDASRCISYLTIEHKSQIPVELRDSMGDWVFGCDVCQDVCPWNRKAAASDRTEFAPTSDRNPLRLTDLFFLDDSQFRQLFGKTPLWRPRRRGLVRNAAIALGNNPCPENLGALKRGLDDLEELIRGASAWALGRHEAKAAIPLLRARLAIETADEVRSEILVALQELGGRTCG